MIRPGQIYQLPITKGLAAVVDVEDTGSELDWVKFIFDDGSTERLWKQTVAKELKLVSEHGTWEEAVNSEEFRKQIDETNQLG